MVVAVALNATALHAQSELAQRDSVDRSSKEEPPGGPAWGFKGYLGGGFPSYDNLPDGTTTESAVSWSAGLYFNWSTAGLISLGIQPELFYVSESGQNGISAAINGTEVVTETQINSLRLPILLKLQFLDPLIIQPSVYVGPAFSYVINAKNVVNGNRYGLHPEDAFQMGLVVGVDANILKVLVVDVRLNANLTTFEGTYGPLAENGRTTLTMKSVQVGLGLRF
jgi:hypothetical protein